MKKYLYAILMLFFSGAALAAEELSDGQTLYLPVYSHVWYGDRVGNEKYPTKFPLSVLVSIRNTSLKTPVRIISARYYSTDGKLLNEYLSKPAVIKAMATMELFVERKESAGGSGANFVIQWDSAAPTNPPMIEAVHVDIRSGNHGLTFITTAHPIQADK